MRQINEEIIKYLGFTSVVSTTQLEKCFLMQVIFFAKLTVSSESQSYTNNTS